MEDVSAQAEATARRSYGRLLAILSARSGDVASAEDALASAFEAALRTWPVNGVPQQPEAWLLTVARRAWIDMVRSSQRHAALQDEMALLCEAAYHDADGSAIPDRRLALMFACAHPALDPAIRAPLMLQTLLGFDAATIASAFLLSPAAMAQKLVRAKKKIRDSRIPFVIPDQSDIPARLASVLDAIYSTYTDSWFDPAGADLHRRNLAEEAISLAQLLCQLAPSEPEVFGLLALMLYAESRRMARRSAQGDYVPLALQDVALWDKSLLRLAERALRHAASLRRSGRYQLEAAIQSAHMSRIDQRPTDWQAVVFLYEQLMNIDAAALADSPVVRINHAIAVAETAGPAAALANLRALEGDERLRQYQPWWAARAHLLARTGEGAAAVVAYDMAIGLESDAAVRRFLQAQRALLARHDGKYAAK